MPVNLSHYSFVHLQAYSNKQILLLVEIEATMVHIMVPIGSKSHLQLKNEILTKLQRLTESIGGIKHLYLYPHLTALQHTLTCNARERASDVAKKAVMKLRRRINVISTVIPAPCRALCLNPCPRISPETSIHSNPFRLKTQPFRTSRHHFGLLVALSYGMLTYPLAE